MNKALDKLFAIVYNIFRNLNIAFRKVVNIMVNKAYKFRIYPNKQ